MMLDREDMADWQYREQNPGYEREIGLTASDLADCDPELALHVAQMYARDNAGRRERNAHTRELTLRQEIDELRALLTANGIDVPERDE